MSRSLGGFIHLKYYSTIFGGPQHTAAGSIIRFMNASLSNLESDKADLGVLRNRHLKTPLVMGKCPLSGNCNSLFVIYIVIYFSFDPRMFSRCGNGGKVFSLRNVSPWNLDPESIWDQSLARSSRFMVQSCYPN